jgi:CHASE2 domain-containing sensor protein
MKRRRLRWRREDGYDLTSRPSRRAVGAAVIAAVVAVGAAFALNQTQALESLELKSIDARFELRGSTKPPPAVVIVGIDPQTFSQLQLQWPFPRHLHGKVIELLKHDGAAAIVYDVQFTEPTTPADRSDGAKRAALAQDNSLIEAVQKAGNVVLASSEVGKRGETDVFGGEEVLRKIGARAGAAIFSPDSDGIDRRMALSYRGLRTLGVVGAEVADGRAISPDSLDGGRAWIDFVGPPGTVREVSFAKVLHNEVPASTFRNKVVVVGATASNLQDVHATPVDRSGLMSGPELTANAIVTAQSGFPLRASPLFVAVFFIVAMGSIAPLASLRFPPVWVLAGAAGLGLAYVLAAQWAFDSGSIVPECGPLAALLLGCVGAVAADSFGERRRLQDLKRAIGRLDRKGPKFFISYRRNESQWQAMLLTRALVERLGSAGVFMDKAAIEPGEIWPREIEEAAAGCAVMLVLIGPGWLGVSGPDGTRRLDDLHDWVRREITTGLERRDCVVVPVLHDGAATPDRESLPEPLRALVDCYAISFTGEDMDAEIDRIELLEQERMRSYLRRGSPIGSVQK